MQNLPVLTAPQLHVHLSVSGLGDPHSEQKRPVFTDPQLQVHEPAGLGLGAPHSMQNLPVLTAPQPQFQLFGEAGAASGVGGVACCWAPI